MTIAVIALIRTRKITPRTMATISSRNSSNVSMMTAKIRLQSAKKPATPMIIAFTVLNIPILLFLIYIPLHLV